MLNAAAPATRRMRRKSTGPQLSQTPVACCKGLLLACYKLRVACWCALRAALHGYAVCCHCGPVACQDAVTHENEALATHAIGGAFGRHVLVPAGCGCCPVVGVAPSALPVLSAQVRIITVVVSIVRSSTGILTKRSLRSNATLTNVACCKLRAVCCVPHGIGCM